MAEQGLIAHFNKTQAKTMPNSMHVFLLTAPPMFNDQNFWLHSFTYTFALIMLLFFIYIYFYGRVINHQNGQRNNRRRVLFRPRKEFYMTVKIPAPNDETLMANTLEPQPIPIGKVAVMYLADVDLAQKLICVCESKPDILHKVHVELLDQMTKYVTHFVPENSHRPVDEEVVLAANRDKWYRAICLESRIDNFTVFFVDYGFSMTVTADKIRKMPPEFMSENKILGNFAFIQGLPDTLNEKLIDRIETLLVKFETYEVEVLHKNAEDGYVIRFPEILRTLKSENII